MWFGGKASFTTTSSLSNSAPNPPSSQRRLDARIHQNVVDYIEQHKRQPCRPGNSSGRYRCTWRCGYSVAKRDAWIQHEETKLPQRMYVCQLCLSAQQGTDGLPHINHRPDKFLEHVRKAHSVRDGKAVREASLVNYAAPFERQCTYILYNGNECGHAFTSWKQRNDHWGTHFEEDQADGSSYDDPPSDDDRPPQKDQDDDDDSNQEDGAGQRPLKLPQKKAPGRKTSSDSHQSGLSRATKSQKRSSSLGHALLTQHHMGTPIKGEPGGMPVEHITTSSPVPRVRAIQLLDVNSRELVSRPVKTRFLALKSGNATTKACCKVRAAQDDMPGSDSARSPDLFKCGQPSALDIAAHIGREMGIRYVWSSDLCHFDVPREESESMYQHAVLIIVAGWSKQHTRELSHLVCAYNQLDTVQTWIQNSVTFRPLHSLGQGAYSFVDKVEVSFVDKLQVPVSHQSFARKVLVRGQSHPGGFAQAARPHEIEIMRKFDHPHIARFVAAYYEDDHLNILMTPVAEHDLSQVLNQPSRFSALVASHMPRWCLSLAEALSHIHKLQCRHKDIKPANILVSGHEVLLTDFGTALDFTDTMSVSHGDALMTPKYCAPEVAARGSRGRSADIWSLGCVFLEMATVMRNRKIGGLHAFAKIRSRSKDRRDTYHHQQPALIDWLGCLSESCEDANTNRILKVTAAMLSIVPERRPSARKVVQIMIGDSETNQCATSNPRAFSGQCACCQVDVQPQAHDSAARRDRIHREGHWRVDVTVNLKQNPTIWKWLPNLYHDPFLFHLSGICLPASVREQRLSLWSHQKQRNIVLNVPMEPSQQGIRNPWRVLDGQVHVGTWRLRAGSDDHQSRQICFKGNLGVRGTSVTAQWLDDIDAICKALFWIRQDADGAPRGVDLSRLCDEMMIKDSEGKNVLETTSSDYGLIHECCQGMVEMLTNATKSPSYMLRFDRKGEFNNLIPATGGLTIISATSHRTHYSVSGDIPKDRLPARLLDLSGNTPRLLETCRSHYTYVALSHYWTSEKDVAMTTRATYQAFVNEIPVSSMSPVIRDAIEMTRQLGFSYIWIDSLCILQDDFQDRRTEISMMRYIYSTATMVLVGLAQSTDQRCTLPTNNSAPEVSPNPPCQLCKHSRPCPFQPINYSSSWSSSPCAYRERYMASRTLYFSTNWLYLRSESGFTLAGRDAVEELTISFYEKRSWTVLEALRKCTLLAST